MSHLVKPVACVCTREFIRSMPAGLRLDLFYYKTILPGKSNQNHPCGRLAAVGRFVQFL